MFLGMWAVNNTTILSVSDVSGVEVMRVSKLAEGKR